MVVITTLLFTPQGLRCFGFQFCPSSQGEIVYSFFFLIFFSKNEVISGKVFLITSTSLNNHSFLFSFIHSSFHSIYLSIYPLTLFSIHSSMHLCFHSFIHSFVYSLYCSFSSSILSLIHNINDPFHDLFINFVYSSNYSFIL